MHEEVLPAPRRCVDDPPALEDEPRAVDLVAEVDGGKLAELDHALGRILELRVEDLAARHVYVPVVDRAAAPLKREREIGALLDDPYVAPRVEHIGDPAHALGLRLPV